MAAGIALWIGPPVTSAVGGSGDEPFLARRFALAAEAEPTITKIASTAAG
jgi:hypothetical protein